MDKGTIQVKDLTVRLTYRNRDDRSIDVTSEDLPGFHFILAKDEKPEESLIPTLKEFISIRENLQRLDPAFNEYSLIRRIVDEMSDQELEILVDAARTGYIHFDPERSHKISPILKKFNQ